VLRQTIYCDRGTITGNNNFIGDGEGQTSLLHDDDGNIVGIVPNPIDPKFVNFTPYSDWTSEQWRDWDLRLLADSPAINKGNNALAVDAQGSLLTTDLDGNSRIIGDNIDMGAYEFGNVTSTPPVTPGNLHDTAKTTDSVTLSWDGVGNATGYEIQYRTGSETWVNVPVMGTSTTIDSLTANTTYEF